MIWLSYLFGRFRFEFTSNQDGECVYIFDGVYKRKYRLSFNFDEECPFTIQLVDKS